MTGQISLKEAERKAFRAKTDDGLWDVLLGCFFLMFPIAIYLSPSLGDFWSSAVFLPFWGLVYLTILLVRKYVVTPRVGVVKFGQRRKTRLMRFSFVLIIVNVVALILGVVAAMTFGSVPGQIYPITLGLILLLGFSDAAYFLDMSRLYIYGLIRVIPPGRRVVVETGIRHAPRLPNHLWRHVGDYDPRRPGHFYPPVA